MALLISSSTKVVSICGLFVCLLHHINASGATASHWGTIFLHITPGKKIDLTKNVLQISRLP